jgi:hypothetical protein
MPVAFFRFAAPTAAVPAPATLIAAGVNRRRSCWSTSIADSPDPGPALRRWWPRRSLIFDGFAPASTWWAVAPWPGFVLAPSNTTYAVVVRSAARRRGWRAGGGDRRRWRRGGRPGRGARRGDRGRVRAAVADAGVARRREPIDVLDRDGLHHRRSRPRWLFARSEAVRAAHDAVIADLHDRHRRRCTRDPGLSRYCELVGDRDGSRSSRRGAAPFSDRGGVFVLDGDGRADAARASAVGAAHDHDPGGADADGRAGRSTSSSTGRAGSPRGAWSIWARRSRPTASPIVGEGPAFVVARYGLADGVGGAAGQPRAPARARATTRT